MINGRQGRKHAEKEKKMAYSGGEREFEIIATEGVVVDCGVDDFIQQLFVAEEVFCDTQPKTEELFMLFQYRSSPLYCSPFLLTGVEQIIWS